MTRLSLQYFKIIEQEFSLELKTPHIPSAVDPERMLFGWSCLLFPKRVTARLVPELLGGSGPLAGVGCPALCAAGAQSWLGGWGEGKPEGAPGPPELLTVVFAPLGVLQARPWPGVARPLAGVAQLLALPASQDCPAPLPCSRKTPGFLPTCPLS